MGLPYSSIIVAAIRTALRQDPIALIGALFHRHQIYVKDLSGKNQEGFPKVSDYSLEIISTPEQIGKLPTSTFTNQLYPLTVQEIRTRISRGSVFFCTSVQGEAAHMSWLVTSARDRREIAPFNIAYPVEVNIESPFTDPKWRQRGLFFHTLEEIYKTATRMGKTRVFMATLKTNEAAVASLAKAGFQLYREGQFWRLLIRNLWERPGVLLHGLGYALRNNLYRRLRRGSIGSRTLYSIAASLYWLARERKLYIGTRIVEIPWVLKQLRVLALNGNELMQLGDVILKEALTDYKATIVDFSAEQILGPGLEVYKADVRDVSLPRDYFDVAISISTLEHIGVMDLKFTDGDRLACSIIHKTLKPGGWFLFTVPFGKPVVLEKMRVYDKKRLDFILDGLFTITESVFIMWDKFRWQKKPWEQVEQAGNLENKIYSPNMGVALIEARKLN